MSQLREYWMRKAIDLAIENVQAGRGGPFGALVVKQNRLIATGVNLVTESNDPTAHAEIVAIRSACRELGSFQLCDCELYSSCEPCPMCLGAIYWARPSCYCYAATRSDAAQAGFDDAFIYDEVLLPPEKRSIPGYLLLREEGGAPLQDWVRKEHKMPY
jgi:guanine deaminase